MNSNDAYYLIRGTGVSSLQLEAIISKDCHYSYYYAKNILKGRFELGETVISKDCTCSYYYAIEILKRRFKLMEGVISKNVYCEYLVKGLRYNHD